VSIRKHDDSIKSGCGIDGKGENFADRAIDPWTAESNHPERDPYSRNDGSSKGDQLIERGADSQNLLVQSEENQFKFSRRDIYDDVDANSSGTNDGFSGPIRAGVNRDQRDGKVHTRKSPTWPR
jgi:hypothetical protein